MQPSYNHQDEMLHITLLDGQARVLLLSTRQLAQEAADIHHTTPVCTAALGRLMTGTLMISAMLKGEKDSVTITMKGGGPAGTLIAVSTLGKVKSCMDNPLVELPLKPDGKLDVGGAVGKEGRMSVVKDMGLKEPYIGQVELLSGEIAEDFAMYFTKSEQQPSLVALGVLVAGGQVLQSGGILVQPLPGCTEETKSQLELRSPMFSAISNELNYASIEQLAEEWFRGLDPVLLEKRKLFYECGCSRERMERALITIGRRELNQLIEEDRGAELCCHFCRNRYYFSTVELTELMKQAARP
jgi:molecular chaperone Hsp33